MDFGEVFSQVWTYIAGGVAGIGGGAFVSWLISFLIARSNNKRLVKTLEAFRSANVVEESVKQFVDKIKAIQLTQNIQPIVESELVKAREILSSDYKKELEFTREKYVALVVCFEKFAEYFSDAYGVSEETKAALHEAIENAKSDVVKNEEYKLEVVVEEPKEEPVVVKKSAKTTNVVR